MTNETVGPALTPEEWTVVQHYCPDGPHGVTGIATNCGTIGSNRHELAAMALYGQPFGFTPEDVGWLRYIAEKLSYRSDPELGIENAEYFARFADRIAALLPPTEHG